MKFKKSVPGWLLTSSAALMLAACGGASETASGPTESAAKVSSSSAQAVSVDSLRISEVDVAAGRIAPSLRSAKGLIDVWVSLAEPSLAVKKRELRPDAAGQNWKASDPALQSQLKSHKQLLQGKQDSAMASLSGLGAVELGRVHVSHNAIAVKIDAARLRDIEAMDGVIAVRPVRHYELMLGETVPYVGGAAAQSAGKDGTGVRVAVLDSGIDYTHRNLGGAGTAAAYAAAWGTSPADLRNTCLLYTSDAADE